MAPVETPAAIADAVCDALRPLAVEFNRLPIRREQAAASLATNRIVRQSVSMSGVRAAGEPRCATQLRSTVADGERFGQPSLRGKSRDRNAGRRSVAPSGFDYSGLAECEALRVGQRTSRRYGISSRLTADG
jgi:hypothetical protein